MESKSYFSEIRPYYFRMNDRKMTPETPNYLKAFLLTFWTFTIGIPNLSSQNIKGLEWEYFGPEQGMGMGFLDIIQDHKGFIWMGSTNGLYRYDGYQIKSFKKYSNNPTGLSSDFIWDIEEDKGGNIWIATYDGGINKRERSSGRFIHFLHDPNDPNGLRGRNVLNIIADTKGKIWAVVKASTGIPVLDRLNPTTGKVDHFGFNPDDPSSLSCDTISITAFQHMQLHPLYLDSAGNVWVATENGLNLYLGEGKGFRRFQKEEGNPQSLSYRQVIAVESSKKEDGVYWVRTSSPGLEHIALDKLNLKTYTIERIFFGSESEAVTNCLGFYLTENESEIWISDRSVNQYLGSAPYYEQRRIALEVPKDESDPRVGIFAHSSGNLLLSPKGPNPARLVRGSDSEKFENGIYYLNPGNGQTTFIAKNPAKNDVPFGSVAAFLEDRSGIIWIGSGGFYKLKISGAEKSYKPVFENYPRTVDGKNGLTDTNIRDIYEESPTVFWLTSYDGLNRLDRQSGEILHFVHDPVNPNSLASNLLFALWHDPQTNQLWIGHEKGIDILNLDEVVSGKPAAVKFHHLRESSGLLNTQANEIKPDGKGNLWIGTSTNGLILFDPKTKKILQQLAFDRPGMGQVRSSFVSIVFTDSKGQTWVAPGMAGICRLMEKGPPFKYECFLDGLFIVDFFEASDGLIWCAAMNYGIVKFNPADNSYELINMENRLARNSVLGIEEDKLGRIWFTSIGLTRYDPKEDTYKAYGKEAGLLGLDPERFFFKSQSGELFYTAYDYALQIFTPEKVVDNPVPPKVVLTGFKLFNEPVPIGVDSPLKESIEVASEVHLAHGQHSFSFEFAGLEFTAPLNNQYRYKMEGVDEDWVFSGTGREARYSMVHPGKYLFQVEAANSDGVWSEEPASIQVIIHSPWWSRWWAYSLFALLFFTATFMAYRYQLKRKMALEEARRLREVDELKTRLYTNITHEFRTPLTIILGMVEQVAQRPEQWFREGLQMIARNGQNLLNLVNQILDLQKIETGAMKVNRQLGDVIAYLRYITDSFHSFAGSKGVSLHFLATVKELAIDYDEDKLLKILSNLLSNAIKYTPPGGDVHLLVDIKILKNLELLEIRVKDTGIGIPSEKQARVFDRFYQVDDSATRQGEGVGIGLALTKELVKLLNGSISVQSEPGKGSEFLVQLPVTRLAPEKKDIPEEKVRMAVGRIIVESPEIPEEEAWPAEGSKEKPIALIIEDNKDVVRYLHACLENDYLVLEAYDGKTGIETAIEKIPDVIISDVMMPEIDGFEVTAMLKKDERTSHIPIILLTARATVEDRISGLERGADAYLAKPFNREELRVRMQKMIELRERLRKRYAGLNAKPFLADPSLKIEDAFVKKVRELVESNMDDPDFSIDDISRSIFLSRTQVHRKLKALTGKSTGHFIRSVRMQHALDLLQNTNKSVTEIAFDVGFRDLSYFSKVFSAEFGKAPSEMRG